MRLILVGDGIASKTLLSLIRKQLASKQPNVFQQHLQSLDLFNLYAPPNTNDPSLPSLATGLWAHALQLLKDRLDISSESLSSAGCAIGKCGYRNQGGEWLISPLKGLVSFPERPSLLFFQNQQLLDLICEDGSIEQFAKEDPRIRIHRNTSITSFLHKQKKTFVQASNDELYEADMIVAADGMASRMREILYNQPIDSYLEHRGYKVYRGVCPASSISGIDTTTAFQTWGPSARFAIVPTNNYQEIAWFAAVTSPAVRPSEHLKSSPNQAALWNGSKVASDEEKESLLLQFQRWHSPIPEVLHQSIHHSIHSIVVNEAFGTKKSHQANSVVQRNSKAAVVFIGDAHFTLDPILAQGAGVAIEQAVRVFDLLSVNLPHPSKYLSSDIDEFERSRSETLKKLHQISNLAQWFGHRDSLLANQLRDGFLSLAPSSIKGKLFDKFIEIVDHRAD